MSETSSLPTPGATDDERATVSLRLPADGAYVSTLRTLTAGLAARLDFTMDDIEDLRIAVSEAAAMVLDEAGDGADLVCDFRLDEDALSLVIATSAAAPAAPDYETFGWQVLATLTAEASIESAPGRYAVHLTVRTSLTS